MKNFLRIAQGVDVIPLLMALRAQPELWGANKARAQFADSPHRHVSDILLRFPDTSAPDIGDQLVCENTAAMTLLPQARHIAVQLMARVEGDMLGRVMITRLAPGEQIYPHADVLGRYANTMNRYHIPLQSDPGVYFHAGDEVVHMAPGEVWDFNAHVEHCVVNNSTADRIQLIIDIRRFK